MTRAFDFEVPDLSAKEFVKHEIVVFMQRQRGFFYLFFIYLSSISIHSI